MSEELIKYLLSIGLPSVPVLLLVYVLVFPEKAEKVSVLIWQVIYSIFKKGSKKIIAHDIQSRINDFSKKLYRKHDIFTNSGIKIEWISEKDKPDEFFKKNKLIIRMRHHANQNNNFVSAAMLFITKSFLIRGKKYLTPTQKESFDLFMAKRLFQEQKPRVEDLFYEIYFTQKTESNTKLMELMNKYELIDKVGLFFPVLIQELQFLGGKTFYHANKQMIANEVRAFIDFLKKHAEREVGDDSIPTLFDGAYCRCGIVIIAKQEMRESGNIDPYLRYINKLVKKKLDNIYLIGSASHDNKVFIDRISNEIADKFSYHKHRSRSYKARIKVRGVRKTVDTYLVHYRSQESIRFYDKEYQAEYFEPATSKEITVH